MIGRLQSGLIMTVLGVLVIGLAASAESNSALLATAPSSEGGRFFGMGAYVAQRHRDQEEATVRQMAEAGVQIDREGFPWQDVEPTRGNYRWSWLDTDGHRVDFDKTIDLLSKHNIAIIGLLDGRPRCVEGEEPPIQWGCGLSIDQRLGDWRRYVQQVVSRYKGKIHIWEIMNEENSRHFWQKVNPSAPGPEPAEYVKLLRAASEVIREEDRNATIILGGLAGYPEDMNDPAANYFAYLAAVQAAGGWPYFDVVAVHPYHHNSSPEAQIPRGRYDVPSRSFKNDEVRYSLREELDALQDLVTSFGAKPIWVTELGWESDKFAGKGGAEEQEKFQAAYLVRAYLSVLRTHTNSILWYAWADYIEGGVEAKWGLVDLTGRKKAVYYAYRTMTSLLANAQLRITTPLAGDGWTMQFEASGGQTVVVAWYEEGGQESREFALDGIQADRATIVQMDGTRTEVSVPGGQVLLRLSELPQYVLYKAFGSAIIIDDLDIGFSKGGPDPERNFRESNEGYKGHLWWTGNSSQVQNWAQWTPKLPKESNYEVLAYIPTWKGEEDDRPCTSDARYQIHHNNCVDVVHVNQRTNVNTWVSLGTFYFAAHEQEFVSLDDATGEAVQPTGKGSTVMGFDAVAFVFKGSPLVRPSPCIPTPQPPVPWTGKIEEFLRRIREAFANFEKKVEDILKGAQQDIEQRIAEELAKLQKEIERIIQEEFEKQLKQVCGAPAMLILGILVVILRKRNH